MTEFAACPTLNEKVRKWNSEISELTDSFNKLNVNDENLNQKNMDEKVTRSSISVNQIISELPNIQMPVLNKTRRRNKSKTPEPSKEKTQEPSKKKTPESSKENLVILLNELNKKIKSENKNENEITELSKKIQAEFDKLLIEKPIYICPSPYSKKRHNPETYNVMGNKVVKKGGKSKKNRKKKNKTKNRK